MRGSYKEITYQELIKLKGNKYYIMIDIRPKYEYDEHHIDGAISIPEYDLIMNYKQLNPKFTYIFICQKGKNSKDVAMTLKQYGYNTINLHRGMEAVKDYEE
jgi:rhodanese-related sulfurtransferase